MLIGGLWHGASWNFVIWGGYHGIILSVERMFGLNREAELPSARVRPVRTLFTFLIVSIGWVFFRARTLGDSALTLHRMFAFENGPFLLEYRHLAFIGITLVLAIL